MEEDDDVIEILPSQSRSARSDLYVSRSRLSAPNGARYDFWGLYCEHDLGVGDFIGMYNGMWISSSDSFSFGNRYAIECSIGVTVAPPGQRPDPRRYPIAMANEPPLGVEANATMQEFHFGREHVENIPSQHNEDLFHGVGLIACVAIPRNTEIYWHYGPRYHRDYTTGSSCRAEANAHPCDALGHQLSFDAVSPMIDSPSNSSDDSDDPNYGRRWRSQHLLHRLLSR